MKEFSNYNKEEAYFRAKKKLEKLVGFYWHFGIFLAVNIFLWVVIAINLSPGESFWTFGHFTTFLFWGIGIVFHFMKVFGSSFLFGKKWEERKIKQIMEKEKKQQWQ
ncbi:2TM domain-containing protein [Flavobacteriaceae bacterium F08102]|nr:2TM domain-containing protein [Flavobacteriaceae bacterium F08102]